MHGRVVAGVGLLVLIGAAFALRLIVATVSPTVIWPDEIFQSLEQAHRLAFGEGVVPWEFRSGARSWLLPGALAAVMKMGAPFADGSSGYLTAVRGVLAAVSLTIPATAFAIARPKLGLRGATVAALACATWFELVFFAPKALSEVVAAHALVPAVWLLEPRAHVASTPRGHVRAPTRAVAAGVLLGLAVALRVHLAPAAAVALLLAAPAARVPAAFAALAPVIASGLLDLATWGSMFHSVAVNVRVNLVDGKSAAFGTAPWYAYFQVFARVWSWAAILVLGLAALGARHAVRVAAVAVVVVATHAAIPHKEYRFLYPALALGITLAGVGLADALTRLDSRLGAVSSLPRVTPALAALTWVTLSTVLAARYDWGDTSMVGPSGEPPFMWSHLRGSLRAFAALSRDDTLCGVGLENRRWNRTGGYAYLHQAVPIFEITSDAAYLEYQSAFNAFVVRRDGPDRVGPFERAECFDNVCVYKRHGGCAAAPGYHLNQRLVAAGE